MLPAWLSPSVGVAIRIRGTLDRFVPLHHCRASIHTFGGTDIPLIDLATGHTLEPERHVEIRVEILDRLDSTEGLTAANTSELFKSAS